MTLGKRTRCNLANTTNCQSNDINDVENIKAKRPKEITNHSFNASIPTSRPNAISNEGNGFEDRTFSSNTNESLIHPQNWNLLHLIKRDHPSELCKATGRELEDSAAFKQPLSEDSDVFKSIDHYFLRSYTARHHDEEKEYEVEKICNYRIHKKLGPQFFLHWKDFNQSERSWECLHNLNCPTLILNYFSERGKEVPEKVLNHIKIIVPYPHNKKYTKVEWIKHQGFKRQNIVGFSKEKGFVESCLKTIPSKYANKLLYQPKGYVEMGGKGYKLFYPSRFATKDARVKHGITTNCVSIALKHICQEDFYDGLICSDYLPKIIPHLTNIKILELQQFNPNHVFRVNHKRRYRRNKKIRKGEQCDYSPIKKIPYWNILNRGTGCLLVEVSTRNCSGNTHLITINFCGFHGDGYIYEDGNHCLRLQGGKYYSKEEALQILSNFNITAISHAWLLVYPETLPVCAGMETLYANILPIQGNIT